MSQKLISIQIHLKQPQNNQELVILIKNYRINNVGSDIQALTAVTTAGLGFEIIVDTSCRQCRKLYK